MKYPIGGKLRQIRERKGTTLKKVAEKAKISASLLSQIETNKVSPSLETLLTITEVLGIDLEYLFREYRQEHRVSVFDGAERNRRVQGGVFYEEVCPVLSADGESDFEVIMLRIPPGADKGSDEYGHPGSEQGIVLEGEAVLHYGSKKIVLRKDNGVSYMSDIPHMIKNSTEKDFVALWVLRPRRIFV